MELCVIGLWVGTQHSRVIIKALLHTTAVCLCHCCLLWTNQPLLATLSALHTAGVSTHGCKHKHKRQRWCHQRGTGLTWGFTAPIGRDHTEEDKCREEREEAGRGTRADDRHAASMRVSDEKRQLRLDRHSDGDTTGSAIGRWMFSGSFFHICCQQGCWRSFQIPVV